MNSRISISHMKNRKLSIYFRHHRLIYTVSPNPSLCAHRHTKCTWIVRTCICHLAPEQG